MRWVGYMLDSTKEMHEARALQTLMLHRMLYMKKPVFTHRSTLQQTKLISEQLKLSKPQITKTPQLLLNCGVAAA